MQKLNIYLVEDNPLLASALKHSLYKCGYNVCGQAPTYEKAVRDLDTLRPDLVITDIMLDSAKTGVDLAAYINHHLHIPFIFQSSIKDAGIIAAAMAQNPISYLPKPINRVKLVDAITTFFNVGCETASV